jgi:formylglycine-generating enzyme required for sulfatase activity/tRNA A-37 threonylcarbamoyl transferase component Bud32
VSDSPHKAVFLSYASQDAVRARQLCDALRAAGLDVWFDQSELRGGDAWDQKIKKQIRECALFLPVISHQTNARIEGYFRLEWKLAVDRSHLMADDALFLLPVVIDEMGDAAARVPDRFREVQWTRILTPEAAAIFAARVASLVRDPPVPAPVTASTSPGPGTPTKEPKTPSTTEPVTGALPEWRPVPEQVVPGTRWVLERKLGEGGFGEVWLGRHQKTKERRVLKFCFREDRVRALKRELTLFRVLKERVGGHPNIVRLLDVHFDEPPFYVEMDYVEGRDLKSWCELQGGAAYVPLATRLELVAQIADALHAAHTAGVIHRDVKPGNILVAQTGAPAALPVAKLSDFGIGQVISEEALEGVTRGGFTESIVVDSASSRSGTQLYMAPELAAGQAASVRTDLHSLGVVLFQLVVGDFRRPLTTDWGREVEDPILREDLQRCFASRAEERFETAEALARGLRAHDERLAAFTRRVEEQAARDRAARTWRRVRTAALAVVVLALGASLTWFLHRASKQRWARQQALPEVNRLLAANDVGAAFALALEVEQHLPDDPALTSLWPKLEVRTAITTTPPGAEVYVKEYRKPTSEWRLLGRTPLEGVRLARTFYRWQFRKEGHETLDQADMVKSQIPRTLLQQGEIPPGMVRVGSGTTGNSSTGLKQVRLETYFLDRYEVTNREFKAFVDGEGYNRRDFWKQPFNREGREISWEEAIAGFRDSTGKAGPATWKNGTYAEGEAEYPVTGVSWFEAAAYAEFAGKRLPSIYHWRNAALVDSNESIVPLSNFSGKGLARVGLHQGMTQRGAFDMAGNAKEWCWNEAGAGMRYLLGGGWNEPDYMFTQTDAESAFSRSPTNGFRCMKLASAATLAGEIDAPRLPASRDFAQARPVSDETFRALRSVFTYDKTDLAARVEATDDSHPLWRKEKVTLNAAYGGERLPVMIFLPKNRPAPHQSVVFFPGASVQRETSSEKLGGLPWVQLIMQGGRAVVYPIYKGTYERKLGELSGPRATRDWLVQVTKDLGRTLDYLETRADFRADRVGYLGTSWGAAWGVYQSALERRIRTNVFVIGGFYQISDRLPEIDQVNYAPRVTVPTLMLNGKYDFFFQVEASQRPMFRLLGTPAEHKRHLLFDSGHAVPMELIASEVAAWFDRYLGPVP